MRTNILPGGITRMRLYLFRSCKHSPRSHSCGSQEPMAPNRRENGAHNLWNARLLVVITVAALSGCTNLGERVAMELIEKQLSGVDEITLVEGDLSLYRGCLLQRGGTCPGDATSPLGASATDAAALAPIQKGLSDGLTDLIDAMDKNHPASLARGVMEHPFLHKVTEIHDRMRGVGGTQTSPAAVQQDQRDVTLELNTDIPEMHDFSRQLNRTVASGAWAALSEHAKRFEDQVERTGLHLEAKRDLRTVVYIEAYLNAYFDQGKMAQVELNTGDLQTEVEGYLARELPWVCANTDTESCKNLVQNFVDQVLRGVNQGSSDKQFLYVTLGTGGFVTRDNQAYQFPGFRVTLDPGNRRNLNVNKIDFSAVGTDLVTVFLQAVFDAHEGLPAIPGATGIDLGPGHEAYNLAVFDPQTGNVSLDDFQRITAVATRVEAAVATSLDRVIRGVGLFSLNNSALEQLVVTAIGTSVRKLVEKAAWCWFACELDGVITDALTERSPSAPHQQLQRVKLRLNIGSE